MTRRVAYVGNFQPAHSTESHVAASLRELDCEVIPLQESEFTNKHAWRVRGIARMVDVDLVLYTRTGNWGLPPIATSTWEGLADSGIRTASLHLDLFWGLAREHLIRDRDPLFTTETVFTADGDPHEWERYGVRHEWLRAGVLRSECRVGVRDPRWEGVDVAFVGSGRRYHSEWPYRRRLVARLAERYGDRFALVPSPGQPGVRGQALNDLYATVPVVVGDSLSFARERSRFWSDRVYETIGRGGVLIHPRIDALVDEVGHLPAFLTYEWGDLDGLCETVDEHVALFRRDPDQRSEWVASSSMWVREHASYTTRMRTLLEHVGLLELAGCS